MSITVKKLFKNGISLYKMNLIAGKNGLNNLVEWVHIVEDPDVPSFLRGNELVFTAGILNNSDNWLLEFAKKLNACNSSAFVINLGPYTKEVPQNVIEYCNGIDMPLFTIPWSSRMVDMTKDFYQRIIRNNEVEDKVSSTFKNIIYNIGNINEQLAQLERQGYNKNAQYCFLAISSDELVSDWNEKESEKIKYFVEKTTKGINELAISFSYDIYRVIVLTDCDDKMVNQIVELIQLGGPIVNSHNNIRVGVGENSQGLDNLSIRFKNAVAALELAIKRNIKVINYDQLDIDKLFFAIEDKSVLMEYYENTIKKLEECDEEKGTNIVEFLKIYLENNGSPLIISQKLFIHRNTVNNQIKKIEKITGYDLMKMEDRVKLFLALYIKDLL